MLQLVLPEDDVVPSILEDLKICEEAIAHIGTVDVDDATWRAQWDFQWAHRIAPMMGERRRYQKMMERALTRVSRRKVVTRP